jgi:putative endonuclease
MPATCITMKKFTSNTQKTGLLGENIACKYLSDRGFDVLERNYTKKWGEIDIITQKLGIIYFIEVKSVSCETLPDLDDPNRRRPEENMHPWKMKRLSRVIQTYLIGKQTVERPWQFDVLLVFLCIKDRKARVKTIENVIL